jgi:hypothetical protein
MSSADGSSEPPRPDRAEPGDGAPHVLAVFLEVWAALRWHYLAAGLLILAFGLALWLSGGR